MTPVQNCPECAGTGKTKIPSGKNAGKETDCENCSGTGNIVTYQGPQK